ncbi:MAG: acyl-CoA desaturase [Gammaproteobacteria bacterium]|nr:acyl-CoA desaturase [Gammaproteobacteria bacterium]
MTIRVAGHAGRRASGNSKITGTLDAYKVNSLVLEARSDPFAGSVKWDPARSLWNGGSLLGAVALGPLTFTWGALAVFVFLLALTMCAGHSVGFHRRLIHRTFDCPKWLERTLVWFGVLVGMQGPYWVIRSHDLRDWAQRQPDCHPYLRHGRGPFGDGWWNLHCRLVLSAPPGFDPGPGIADDAFHRFLQRTWMAHQVPVALLLFMIGGVPWVVWGVVVRVAVGVHSHWYVGYLCHTRGPQDWLVDDGAIQAHNVTWAAIPSMGECWHNNHHAFPASARHGLYPGQLDPGFRFVELLERIGLAWNVKVAERLPPRTGITAISPRARRTLALQADHAAPAGKLA